MEGLSENILKEALTLEQKEARDAVLDGQNVFITGAAGVGKSHLTNILIQELRKKHGTDKVYVTASTGIAATHIGGTTLHSFAGIGIDFSDMNQVMKKAWKNKGNWTNACALVIDEISMVSPAFFTALDLVGRRVRKQRDVPFGGIQLVVLGDFLQLPPIDKDFEDRKRKDPSLKRNALFSCKAWEKCIQRTFLLTIVHRQKNMEFVHLLNRVRMGTLTPEDGHMLRKRVNARLSNNGILPTRIYTHKSNVENENYIHLNKLTGKEYTYDARDTGPDEYALRTLQKNCLAPATLKLKVDAQVMLLKNMEPPLLVNGSRGRVVAFKRIEAQPEEKEYPVIEFENGEVRTIGPDEWVTKQADVVRARRNQVPLCLAWALTVHKCQGMTLDKVTLDISRCFAPGQAYVGLSRCSTLEGLSLLGFNPKNLKADPDALEFYARLGDTNAKAITQAEPEAKKARIDPPVSAVAATTATKTKAPVRHWWEGRI